MPAERTCSLGSALGLADEGGSSGDFGNEALS